MSCSAAIAGPSPARRSSCSPSSPGRVPLAAGARGIRRDRARDGRPALVCQRPLPCEPDPCRAGVAHTVEGIQISTPNGTVWATDVLPHELEADRPSPQATDRGTLNEM